MEKCKVTVVIESPTAVLRLGMDMAGGRVTSLSKGDKIEVADKYEPPELIIHGKPQKVRLSGVVPPTPGRPAGSPPQAS
jgi:endonuclease YncB( thermonuclease family)